jgi:O-antigen/teichoic acid export membrane protein
MMARLLDEPANDRSARQAAAAPIAPARPLIHSFSWSLAGMLTYGACQWGMLVVLARLGNSVVVGQFALALAVTAPVMLLAGMSLRTIQATDHAGEFSIGDYVGMQAVSIGLAILVVISIAMISGRTSETRGAILLVGLAKAFELGSELLFGVLQRNDQMDRIGKSLILKGLSSVVAIAVGIHLTGSVVGAAAFLAIAWGLLLAVYDVPNALAVAPPVRGPRLGALAPRWNPRHLRSLARLAIPMGVAAMLGAVIANLPRYFIKGELGESALGVFAALAYVAVAGHLLAGALAQAALPRLSRCFAAGDAAGFRRLVLGLVGLGAAIGLAATAVALPLGRPFLDWLYGAEYSSQSGVFLVLMLSLVGVMPVYFLDFAIFAARRFRVLTPFNGIVVVVMAAACWWLVPRYGLAGAAWATCLGVAVQALLRAIFVWRLIRAVVAKSVAGNELDVVDSLATLSARSDA